MPAYVIVKTGFDRTTAEADALMDEPGLDGPDRKTGVPVKVKRGDSFGCHWQLLF
jgi:hypothetical protein